MTNCKKNKIEEFIKKAKQVHGDKYDYSKVEYVNINTKVCIICPEHGEFWQVPNSHLRGFGCRKCTQPNANMTTEEFIEKAKQVHGDKYDYSKVEYVNTTTKVCIICPEHGEFWQLPKEHLNKKGCIKCSNTKKYTTEEFIEKAKQVHGDKYDYSKSEYISAHKQLLIICPEHGEFWQTPRNHYRWGCKHCHCSTLERETEKFLNDNHIEFEKQKKFEWLFYKDKLSIDFFIPKYNIAIECQGEQHFTNLRYKDDINKLELRQTRDLIKYTLCKAHGIKMYYYCNDNKYNEMFGEKIHHDLNNLLKNIKYDK